MGVEQSYPFEARTRETCEGGITKEVPRILRLIPGAAFGLVALLECSPRVRLQQQAFRPSYQNSQNLARHRDFCTWSVQRDYEQKVDHRAHLLDSRGSS